MKRSTPVWTWPVAPPHKSITLPQRTFPHFHSSQTYLSLFRGLWHNLWRDGDAFDFFWSWNCLYWAFKNMISEDDYWYWATSWTQELTMTSEQLVLFLERVGRWWGVKSVPGDRQLNRGLKPFFTCTFDTAKFWDGSHEHWKRELKKDKPNLEGPMGPRV